MSTNEQNQKAGDNSLQLQANNIIVNTGIDEKRAREICSEMYLQAKDKFTEEAKVIANLRVANFENQLLPIMESVVGALEAFADPSFQLLLVEAQKTAASTARPADYELLSQLLVHRVQKGENRFARAGISRAVEIVDEISDDALLGLTALHSVSYFIPTSGDIHQGLDALDSLFNKLLYNKLPAGDEWLDHLAILDTIRINPSQKLKKLEQLYPIMLNNYIEIGIEKQSENFEKALELIKEYGLPQNILVEHSLNSSFSRVNIFNRNQIDSLIFKHEYNINGAVITNTALPSEEQKNALRNIYDLYKQDEIVKQENIKVFIEELKKRSNLKTLIEWWGNISTGIQITSVGKVLAHSNAQRCDTSLPPLN